MSNPVQPTRPDDTEIDPALERIQQDRRPGEMETAMASGSDEETPSATEPFEGELTREEALEVLAPEGEEAEEASHHRPGVPAKR